VLPCTVPAILGCVQQLNTAACGIGVGCALCVYQVMWWLPMHPQALSLDVLCVLMTRRGGRCVCCEGGLAPNWGVVAAVLCSGRPLA
jgi:hypothetical protein